MHLRQYFWVSSFLFLLACGSDTNQPPTHPDPIPVPDESTADAPPESTDQYRFDFLEEFPGLSPSSDLAELQSVFGADQVSEGVIYLVDGIEIPGYIVHKGQPAELNIFVPDSSEDVQELNILIRQPGAPWTSQEGIKMGTTLAELVRINEAPISFAGFGWDYGGYISDWQGGRLNGAGIRLEIQSEGDADYPNELMGEVDLRSDNPLLQEVPVIVAEIEIRLTADPIKIGSYLPGQYFDRIRPNMTRDDLLELYGAEQLRDSQIHIGEGEYMDGAFLFPATPAEVQILYQETAHAAVASIRISQPETPFYLQDIYQLTPGLDLPGLVALNGAPLEFAGFGWDYAGTVLDWQGGELEGMGVVLRPLDYDLVPQGLIGDKPILSTELNTEEMLLFEVAEITVPL